MQVEDVKKYVEKNVLIILNNGFRYTIKIPEFEGNCFSVIDKYGHNVTITCDMISLISEVNER